MTKVEELAKIINDNPNCVIDIYNDYWQIYDREPNKNDSINDEPKSLAHSDDFKFDTKWYSSSNDYGHGISDALVILLNQRGFNIKANAV